MFVKFAGATAKELQPLPGGSACRAPKRHHPTGDSNTMAVWGRQSWLKRTKSSQNLSVSKTTEPPLVLLATILGVAFLSQILYGVLTLKLLLPGGARSGAESTRSPLPGMGHLVSPTCPRAGAAPTRGSWNPASSWCLSQPVVPRPAMAHSRVRYPASFAPHPTGALRNSHLSPAARLSARPPGPCWGTSQSRHDSWRAPSPSRQQR